MSKLKTNKSVLKRLKVTAKKKLMRRPNHQNHNKSKLPGRITRTKHRVFEVASSDMAQIKKLLPYL